MKKVIEIASLDFSGSTMLDLMLGNSPQGFSIGEAHAFYNGKRFWCTCEDNEDCKVWNNMRGGKFEDMYSELFELTGKEYMVYSGKLPRNLLGARRNNNFDFKTIIIYKHPAKLLKSQSNRPSGMFSQDYMHIHNRLIQLFPNALILSLKDLVIYPRVTVEEICRRFDIKYYDNMEVFWKRKTPVHMLFGSSSARLHLLDPGTPRFLRLAKQRNKQKDNDAMEVKHHREFYWSEPKKKYEDILRKSGKYNTWMNTYKFLESVKLKV